MSARTVGVALLIALRTLHASAAPDAGPAASGAAGTSEADTTSAPARAAAGAGAAGAPSTASVEAPSVVVPSESPGPTAASASQDETRPAASSDSFSNDDTVEAEQQHRLDLYGFADLTYTRLLIPKSSPWNRIYYPTDSFAVGNFNLYLSSNLGDSWRALGEVRFLYLPNGATTTDNQTGQVSRTDTTVLDYAGFEEPIHWGAIRIERIWVEHEFSALFKLQVGAFLTPYGIWNVDHGTPAIVGIRAPFAVAEELFPAHQTGLQLYGNTFFDPVEVGYHLTLSNGRGPVEYQDFNDDKALGGRLYLKTDSVGSLTLGTSAYRGGYYDRSAKYVILNQNGNQLVDQTYTTIAKYEEFAFAADLKWQWKRWLVQSEFIMNDVAYDKNARPRLQVLKPPQGFQSDYRRWGAYGLVGYRTNFIQTMPYVVLQYAQVPNNPIVPPTLGLQIGLNIHPTPAVVLKLEFTAIHFSGPGSIQLGNYPLRILGTQVAWAF
ncbi:MAG: hypothetical protein ABW061_20475 [Polyangiaceae bacterium]